MHESLISLKTSIVVTKIDENHLKTDKSGKITYQSIALQNFSQKCPLFGFQLISTNFGSLIPNPKSVFGCVV